MFRNPRIGPFCLDIATLTALSSAIVMIFASSAAAYDPKYDLDNSSNITFLDWNIVVRNWTGEIRDGTGTSTPSQGDFDGDGDIDDMDMLEFAENRGEGPLCVSSFPDYPAYPSVTPAKLEYDPATGNLRLLTRMSECQVAAYTLKSESGSFSIDRFVMFQDGFFAFETMSRFQVGASRIDPTGGPASDWFRPPVLGRILPPLLDEEGIAEAVSGAWFAPFSMPRAELEFEILPMPSLGDTDRDSDVDSLDLLNLMANWTGAATEPGEFDKIFDEGDFDFDSDVDSNDMLILMEGWTGAQVPPATPAALNAAAGTSAVTVPEPSSLAAALAACAAFVPLLRRRRTGAA